MLDAYRNLSAVQGSNSALDAKTRELIAMAVAITSRCDGCISSDVVAKRAGATETELKDTLGTAISLNAGAAYVYSLRALEEIKV